MAVLIIAVVVAAAVAVLAVRSRFWFLGPCPACRGRKGRGIGSTDQSYNRCRRCGGSGERIRPLALMWPRHREAARKRRQARERSRR